MVGRHATQTFVEVGPLELKGIPEPVDAVEVLWEPATVGGFGAVAGPVGRRGDRCAVRVLRSWCRAGGVGGGAQAGARLAAVSGGVRRG